MSGPHVILVASGRSGMGATTVAALLAMLAAADRRVLLLTHDGNLQIAHPSLTILPLTGHPRLTGDYELVIIDSGSRMEAIGAALDLGVHRLLCLTAGDRFAAASAHALIKFAQGRLPSLKLEVIANRLSEPAASAQFDELDAASRRFLGRTLRYGGAVPDDECLRAGVAAGMAILDAASGSPATAAIHTIGTRILRQIDSRTNEGSPAVDAPRPFQRRS
ncbi:MAG TPA: hypothetical protein VFI91_12630 [Longimicrobiaceae bacterium]|nr:hypothetical protein [Longimicrobiaceae bacterium]